MNKIYNKQFDETIYQLKLKNGTTVHLLPKDKPFLTTYVGLSVPIGGLTLQYKLNNKIENLPPGSAHFFEHKIFAMPNGEDAFSQFSRLGLDANATTSYNQTTYFFTTTNGVIPGLKVLLDMIDNPYFTDENIAVEEQIIAEELDMYLDDIDSVMSNNLLENMYYNHPLKHDIGGTKESIKEIDKNVLNRIYKTFYQQNQRLIVIAGNIDIEEIESFFKDYDKKPKIKQEKFKVVYPKEPNSVFKKNEIKEMPVFSPKLMMGLKLKPQKDNIEILKEHIAATILLSILFGKSSKAYQDLLNENLTNQQFYCNPVVTQSAFFLQFYAESKQPKKLRKRLIDVLFNFEDIFNKTDFERIKRSFIGQFVFVLNGLTKKAMTYANYLHNGISLYDVLSIQQSITYEDVINIGKKFNKNHLASLIYIKPKLNGLTKND